MAPLTNFWRRQNTNPDPHPHPNPNLNPDAALTLTLTLTLTSALADGAPDEFLAPADAAACVVAASTCAW